MRPEHVKLSLLGDQAAISSPVSMKSLNQSL
jgi:hypothetical protein